MKQSEVVAKLNNSHKKLEEDPLKECEDIYCSCDAINDSYILEIKSRDRQYDPWLIERDKFVSNYDKAIETGRNFIYLTEYKTKIITWNINDLVASGYDFGWEVRELPETTAFENNEPILKEVGYLYEQYGKKI